MSSSSSANVEQLLRRLYWIGTSRSCGKGQKDALSEDVLIATCDAILKELGQSRSYSDSLFEKIRISPKTAGAILLGVCFTIKSHYNQLENRVKDLLLKLIRGRAVSEPHVTHETTDKVQRRPRRRQVVETEESQDVEVAIEEFAEPATGGTTVSQATPRKNPATTGMVIPNNMDMSWLVDPDFVTGVQALDDMVERATQQLLLSAQEGGTGGTSSVWSKEFQHSSGVQEVQAEVPVQLAEEDDNFLAFIATRSTPVPSLDTSDHVAVDVTPHQPTTRMREVALEERSAIRGDLRLRTSIDVPESLPAGFTAAAAGQQQKQLAPKLVMPKKLKDLIRRTNLLDKQPTLNPNEYPNCIPKVTEGHRPYKFEMRALNAVPVVLEPILRVLYSSHEDRFRLFEKAQRKDYDYPEIGIDEFGVGRRDTEFSFNSAAFRNETDSARTSDLMSSDPRLTSDRATDSIPSSELFNQALGSVQTPAGPLVAQTPDMHFGGEESIPEVLGADLDLGRRPAAQFDPTPHDPRTEALRQRIREYMSMAKAKGLVEQISFTEIVPPGKCKRWQASITLRGLLFLAGSGELTLNQMGPLGAILINKGPIQDDVDADDSGPVKRRRIDTNERPELLGS